jgi:asparagine synthase (glutamine-hydrolysing)
LPGSCRAALGRLATLRQSKAAADKLADMLRSDGSILSLALQRRRAMSAAQLAALGLAAQPLGLSPDFQPPSALEPFSGSSALDEADPIWSISQIESRFYQSNMLLLDADVNSMAHSLEIRVPLLDRRMLDFAHALPGPLRLPSGRADKHLLRAAFGDLLRPELLQQRKKGFALPIAQWMGGPLRDWCQAALSSLKSLDLLRPAGVDAVWRAYAAAPASQAWSRAFTLCVLGNYLKKMSARG